MKNEFIIVIPARMDSNRLPGKMLLDVAGLPLIVRTAQAAMLSEAKRVIIATDHQEILAACHQHQLEAIMTSALHQSGSDRLCEVVTLLQLADDEIIINVQGDEPLINPQLINQLAEFIYQNATECATIAHPISSLDDIFNPNIVKTVLNHKSCALYFSRAPIPYYRDGYAIDAELKARQSVLPPQLEVLRHIGIYAYKVGFLKLYHQLPHAPLEQVEALEQLRILYNGYQIGVMHSPETPAPGVDTLDDLLRVREIINSR